MLEAEIVNYKGDKLIVNKDVNSDLFWAIMGSGGCNFGVITSMTISLNKKADMGSLIYINYPNANNETILKVILNLQEMFKSLDRRMNLKTAIYNSSSNGQGIKLTGLFYGSSIEAKDILRPILNVSREVEVHIEDRSILECNRWIQDSHPDYEKYKSTGRFVNRDYEKEEINRLIEIISNPAEGFQYTAVSLYGLGGAVADVDKLSTAYYYRDSRFIMGIQSVWEEDEYASINKKWVRDNFKFIQELTEGSFVNFPIDELNDYEKEYYGENSRKLREIKAKYDPYNIFDYPQAIKVREED